MTSEKQEFNFFIGNERKIEDLKSNHKLFTGQISFIKGIKSFQDIPEGDFTEICFSGRSNVGNCLLYTSPSPRDNTGSRIPSSA